MVRSAGRTNRNGGTPLLQFVCKWDYCIGAIPTIYCIARALYWIKSRVSAWTFETHAACVVASSLDASSLGTVCQRQGAPSLAAYATSPGPSSGVAISHELTASG